MGYEKILEKHGQGTYMLTLNWGTFFFLLTALGDLLPEHNICWDIVRQLSRRRSRRHLDCTNHTGGGLTFDGH